MLALLAPDGSYIGSGHYGRGTAGLTDSAASSQQFSVFYIDGRPDLLVVENLGLNPLIVEKPGGVVVDFLETGESAQLYDGTYFFLPQRRDTTKFTVCQHPSATSGIPEAEPPAKRARMESSVEARPDSSAASSPWPAPFSLLRVQGIPDYANRPPAGIRLRDVVCGDVEWILVSNYEVDMGWLFSACPALSTAGHIVVVHGESHPAILSEMKQAASRVGLDHKKMVIHAPPLPISYGTHHSKAFIVEYAAGVRVVIHTANLIHCDNNHKSQGLWVQDFPPKDVDSPRESEFETRLVQYLRMLRLPAADLEHAIHLCRDHDFSSARTRLICSWPGYHQGAAAKQVGHMALRTALAKEEFDLSFRRSPVFAQFSSMGSLDAKWLHQEFQASLSAGRCQGTQSSLGEGPQDARGLQLIWPTVGEVRNSVEGWAAGRSIPGFSKNVSKPFLQPLFHRFGGEPAGRQRAMPHIKSFGRYQEVPGQGTRLAWLLLASHNLSKAAWGALQKNGSQLMVRSYEMGVLLLPSLEAKYRAHRHCGFTCTPKAPVELPTSDNGCRDVEFWARSVKSEARMDLDKAYLLLPYSLPPVPYEAGDEAWMVDVPRSGLDSYGRGFGEDYPPMYGLTEDD